MTNILAFGPVLRSLRHGFQQAIDRAAKLRRPVVVAISLPVDTLDPFECLAAMDDGQAPYFFWEGPESETAFFAWDCAIELQAAGVGRFGQIGSEWQTLCDEAVIVGSLPPRLCGGFRFDTAGPRQSHWQDFGDASLIVARLIVLRQSDKTMLLCQHLATGDDDPLSLAAGYCAALLRMRRATPAHAHGAATVSFTHDAGERQAWQDRVAAAVDRIQHGDLDKVVLARVQYGALGGTMPSQVIGNLRKQSPGAQIFACRRGEACFLGASPERLATIAQGWLHTHALAGTIARGLCEQEDAQLGRSLLDSAKDRHEHFLVVQAVTAALAPFCDALDMPKEPILKRLPRVQHLETPIAARLRDDASVMAIIEALHPTPAVGGQPRAAALRYIREHERWDRGWYAAPVGWLDGNGDGDFLVALRSALLTGDRAYLFAGCGIVGDSIPEHEYEETCLKLSAMSAAFIPGRDRPPTTSAYSPPKVA